MTRRIGAALCFVAAVSIAIAAQNTHRNTALHIFRSADRLFRFDFSGLLQCRLEAATDNQELLGQEACVSYFGVCGDAGNPDLATVACFAYPKDKFQNKPTFTAGAFAVAEVRNTASAEACLRGSPNWVIDKGTTPKTVTINGVKFRSFKVGEGGMSHGLGAEIYRTFHRGECYELSVSVETTSPAAYEETIEAFTPEDQQEVYGRLRAALKSFTFLK